MGLNTRGSQWRKWDLHIHTPHTKLNNQYKVVEGGDVWKEYCEKLEASDVHVFGITDYFSSDNYFTFLDNFKKHFPKSQKKFFLNIEFRLSVSVNRRAEEVNLHLIFSDKVTRAKIEEFLLKLNTNITKGGVAVPCKNLSGKGEFESAAVEYSKMTDKLHEVFGSERCYIIVAASNNSGLRPDSASPRKLIQTDEIDKISDAFFGGAQNTEYYLKIDRFENNEVSKPKPVVGGSDAHSFEDINNFVGKQVIKNSQGKDETVKDVTWIKAEPTFEGLLQILNEPTRVFIGEQPPIVKRVNTHPTKYIKSLNVKKIDDSQLNDLWFNDLKIDFNPELVAII
jgi:exonuclease SbcC